MNLNRDLEVLATVDIASARSDAPYVDALRTVQNGNGARSTAEYIRWLAARHPDRLDASEADAHATRLETLADSMDAIARLLAGLS